MIRIEVPSIDFKNVNMKRDSAIRIIKDYFGTTMPTNIKLQNRPNLNKALWFPAIEHRSTQKKTESFINSNIRIHTYTNGTKVVTTPQLYDSGEAVLDDGLDSVGHEFDYYKERFGNELVNDVEAMCKAHDENIKKKGTGKGDQVFAIFFAFRIPYTQTGEAARVFLTAESIHGLIKGFNDWTRPLTKTDPEGIVNLLKTDYSLLDILGYNRMFYQFLLMHELLVQVDIFPIAYAPSSTFSLSMSPSDSQNVEKFNKQVEDWRCLNPKKEEIGRKKNTQGTLPAKVMRSARDYQNSVRDSIQALKQQISETRNKLDSNNLETLDNMITKLLNDMDIKSYAPAE
jgi:hypothetical protein